MILLRRSTKKCFEKQFEKMFRVSETAKKEKKIISKQLSGIVLSEI